MSTRVILAAHVEDLSAAGNQTRVGGVGVLGKFHSILFSCPLTFVGDGGLGEGETKYRDDFKLVRTTFKGFIANEYLSMRSAYTILYPVLEILR